MPTLHNDLDRTIELYKARKFQETGTAITTKDVSKAFGEAADMSPNALILIKSGNYQPSVTTALQLAEFFGTTVDALFKLVGD